MRERALRHTIGVMFKEEIFKAYDIRGKIGVDFDNGFAYKLGKVLIKQLNAKKIVVGRDTRASSEGLAGELIRGVTDAGAEVIDIGAVSTPLFYFGVIHEEANCGVMVTASHLGEEFNGFKMTKEKAIVIGGAELYKDARELFNEDGGVAEKKGVVATKDLREEYIKETIKLSGLKIGDIKSRIKLVGNDVVVGEASAAAKELSIEIVDRGEDIGFEFDSDGDRITVLDKSGAKISGDRIGGLIASHYFADKKVVYDLRYSMGVLEYLESKGVEAVPSRIGHKKIKDLMRELDIEFCGEQSGHFYFKSVGYVESSILAMFKVLGILAKTGASIDELAGAVSSWSTTEEIYFDLASLEDAKNILDRLKERYSDGRVNESDGILVEYPNWRFLLRPSNTEPKLKLIVDAREPGLLEEKKGELLELLM